MSDLKPIIEQSFTQYAGAVLQSRALIDVRDCLKPSARQIFYSLYTDKFLSSKPYKKTLKAVGSLSRFYIHGDQSAVGVLMRAGQHFAMRYPLADVKGNAGTLLKSGNWASQRYTETRLSEICEHFFTDIQKETIHDWRDNYDDTEQYPSVLPSKGYYNIVNGTLGIGIGAASNIPQFNLKEVNQALIKLLWNPDSSFEDLYCPPDFATGGTLLNENEVKESLKRGEGKACKLRATIQYEVDQKCLIVTEIPFSVYTNTICKELEEILEDDEHNPGIDRFNDLTGTQPLIKIYLKKRANATKVIKYLYKNTSLQSHYRINMTMLKDGRYPRVFGWKEALEEHIAHEKAVYHRSFNYDKKKILARLHIIEGILIALANIDEVVEIIKKSTSTTDANQNLCENFHLSSIQAQAILKIQLAKLARLEVQKYKDEQGSLNKELDRINYILNNEDAFKKEIQKGFEQVIKKYGDNRRTQIMNIETEDEEEPLEITTLQVNLTNKNNLIVNETSSLYIQRRGGVGNKLKLDKGEYIKSTITGDNIDTLLVFTTSGVCYHASLKELSTGIKVPLESIISIKPYEEACALTTYNPKKCQDHILFLTKDGMVKKTVFTEYGSGRKNGLKAIELSGNDKIVEVIFTNTDKLALATSTGRLVLCETKDINAVGRVAKGVKAIKLLSNESLVAARSFQTAESFITISKEGLIKRTDAKDFVVTNRNTRGTIIQKLKDGNPLVDLQVINGEKEILIISSKSQLKTSINEIPITNKGNLGNKGMSLKEDDVIIGLSKF